MDTEIVLVSAQDFLKHYAPFEPSESDFELCIKYLISKDLITESKGRQSWSQYLDRPSKQYNDESTAYRSFKDIFDAISQAQVPDRVAFCEYHSKYQSTTASKMSGTSYQVDGYLMPKQSTMPTWERRQKIPTADLTLNVEFEL
jgi:hypothetical protein